MTQLTDTPTKACLISATLDGAGGWRTLDLEGGAPRLADGVYWVHINANHPEAAHFLGVQLNLPEPAVKALLAEEVSPRYIAMGEDCMIFLRGITMVPGPDPGDLASLRLWVTPQGVVSIGRRKSHTAGTLKKLLTMQDGPTTVAEMVVTLLEIINDALEPLLQEINGDLEGIEDSMSVADAVIPRRRSAEIRRQISQYRRHLSPQRDMLNRLAHAQRAWLDDESRWRIQEARDRTNRFIEDLDHLQERGEIIADDVNNTQNARLNKNLYLLSMITVIFMPLSFLTGLFGMNVEGILGAAHPNAFLLIVGVSVFIALIQLLLFRRFRWL